MKIVIPTVPKSLNHLMTLHWSQRYRYGKQMEKTVWAYCVKAKQEQHIIWKKFSRVEITFYFDDDRRRDKDNFIAGFKKGQDGLVLAKLIEDDSWQDVRIAHKIKKGEERTEIELW